MKEEVGQVYLATIDSEVFDPNSWRQEGGRWTKRRRQAEKAEGGAGQVYLTTAKPPMDTEDSGPSRSRPKRRRGNEQEDGGNAKREGEALSVEAERDELWATHEVTLLAKVTNALLVKDFRPIAVLPVMYKLYSWVLYMLGETHARTLRSRSSRSGSTTRHTRWCSTLDNWWKKRWSGGRHTFLSWMGTSGRPAISLPTKPLRRRRKAKEWTRS